jgi:hypothetical protein
MLIYRPFLCGRDAFLVGPLLAMYRLSVDRPSKLGNREDEAMIKGNCGATAITALLLAFGSLASAQTPAKKPNIVLIMGDDVEMWNISGDLTSSAIVGQFLQTFKEYPPSQTSGTFGIEKALKMIEAGSSGGGK